MTVSYAAKVATSSGFSCFLRLLARWRGSIYKIIWLDLVMFLALYYVVSASYHFLPDNSASKEFYGNFIEYCKEYGEYIPISFVLGFYVSLVTTRWWDQYCHIPYPDNLAILVGASIKGQDDKARIVRRSIVRYICAAFTITLTMLSPKAKKRFPTIHHLVEAGLLTPQEEDLFEELNNEYPTYAKYWLPVTWAANVTTKARHEGLIREDVAVKDILDEINHFRSCCNRMLDYDWINIPLVYTQVVTVAVYAYFLIAIIGKQHIDRAGETAGVNFYFPILLILEFFFYMGWLKVAEVLINPYGDDDDDFEVVWLIDRHLQICYLIVDKIHHKHPKLIKDKYWEEIAPNSLPHTIASQQYMKEYPFPSTMNVTVTQSDQDIIVPEESHVDSVKRSKSSAESYRWRELGMEIRKRNQSEPSRLSNLEKVTCYGASKYEMEEINEEDGKEEAASSELTIPLQSKPDVSGENCSEFKILLAQRRNEYKQRILKLVQLAKSEKEEDVAKLVDELIK